MQKLILIKDTDDRQLAHVYEHAFCDAINNYLTIENNYIDTLDFFIEGRTFYSGAISIEIIFFIKNSEYLKNHIKNIKINENNILPGLRQVLAEKQATAQLETDKIIEEVLKLDTQTEWQNLSSITYIDDQNKSFQDKLQLCENNKKSNKLSIEIRFNKSIGESLALAPFIATLIKNNLHLKIMSKYSSYYAGDNWDDDRKHLAEICEILLPLSTKVDDKIIENFFQETIKLLKNNTPKIKHFFSTADFSKKLTGPDFVDAADKTGYLVGEKGWKKLSTDENILSVLDDANICIKNLP